VRFGQGQGQVSSASPRSPGPSAVASAAAGTLLSRGAAPTAGQTASTQPGAPLPPSTPVPPPLYTPSGPGTLTPPGSPPKPGPSALEPASTGAGSSLRQPSSVLLPPGSALDQYNFALGLIKQADYPAAEEALRSFVQQHPNDALSGNAQYWLGETYYQRERYADAAVAFAEGYKRYPKGPKAADDLLKLGMSLSRANQKQNACITLAQLDRDFPNPGNTIKDRAKDEKKKLGC
jgi:tol-pal system protein YbgF